MPSENKIADSPQKKIEKVSPKRCHRSAKTLVEVVVIISLLSVLMGLSVTSLATLFRVRRQIQADSEQGAAIHRLAMRLRSDAHEAVLASADDGLVLELADGQTIHYSYSAPRIARQIRRDDAVLHHDTFRLSRAIEVRFSQEKVGTASLIRLAIRPAETRLPPRDIPRNATIEAVVGLHGSLGQIARQP